MQLMEYIQPEGETAGWLKEPGRDWVILVTGEESTDGTLRGTAVRDGAKHLGR